MSMVKKFIKRNRNKPYKTCAGCIYKARWNHEYKCVYSENGITDEKFAPNCQKLKRAEDL